MYLLFRLQRNELFFIFANDFQESLEFKKINYYLQLIEPNGFLCGTTQQRSATYLLCICLPHFLFIFSFPRRKSTAYF
jgi:hypothetical protein